MNIKFEQKISIFPLFDSVLLLLLMLNFHQHCFDRHLSFCSRTIYSDPNVHHTLSLRSDLQTTQNKIYVIEMDNDYLQLCIYGFILINSTFVNIFGQ